MLIDKSEVKKIINKYKQEITRLREENRELRKQIQPIIENNTVCMITQSLAIRDLYDDCIDFIEGDDKKSERVL